MTPSDLAPNRVVRGAIFPEPVQVLVVVPIGDSLKLIGKSLKSSRVYEPMQEKNQLITLRRKAKPKKWR